MSKMYILVRENISRGMAITAAAHASLACYLEYKHEPEMVDWLDNSFKKVVCIVTDAEMSRAMVHCDKYQVMNESNLNNEETCVVFMPRKIFPKMFKFLRLYK